MHYVWLGEEMEPHRILRGTSLLTASFLRFLLTEIFFGGGGRLLLFVGLVGFLFETMTNLYFFFAQQNCKCCNVLGPHVLPIWTFCE